VAVTGAAHCVLGYVKADTVVTTHQDLVRRELMRRELLARDLMSFTREMERSYKPGWVHYDICHRLEKFSDDVIEERSPRLMLLLPPRTGKSTLASIMFPLWHLGRRPDHEIINVGYNLDLPTTFSRKVREVMRTDAYAAIFPETKLDNKSQAVEAWLTTRFGGFKAVGRSGGITGFGAHALIVDDPLKNLEEADNFDIREKLEDWYFSAAYTRLAPGGGVLFIETMWSDDDLAGRLLSKMQLDPLADQFEVVRYPAISMQYEYRDRESYVITRSDTPIRKKKFELLRKPGEALHPERYSLDYLQRIKSNAAPRIWSALYQQDPVPREGLIFKEEMFHIAPVMPIKEYKRYYMAWDFAISQKKRADFTVGVCLMQDENDNLYLVDLVRFQGDSKRISDEFIGMILRWNSFEGSTLQLGVEDGQIWKALKNMLTQRMREEGVYKTVEALAALSDKLNRATELEGRMALGRFWFIEGSPWWQETQREMQRFPAGRNDDIVDALAWAVRLATGKRPRKTPSPKRAKSWKDSLSKFIGGGGNSHMAA